MEILKIISTCNAYGIRIYPVPYRGQYALEIEFNRNGSFEKRNVRKLIRSEELYPSKGTLWHDKLIERYRAIFEKRIRPKLDSKREITPSRIQPIYKKK